jgi:hypothetical protein
MSACIRAFEARLGYYAGSGFDIDAGIHGSIPVVVNNISVHALWRGCLYTPVRDRGVKWNYFIPDVFAGELRTYGLDPDAEYFVRADNFQVHNASAAFSFDLVVNDVVMSAVSSVDHGYRRERRTFRVGFRRTRDRVEL